MEGGVFVGVVFVSARGWSFVEVESGVGGRFFFLG